MHIVAHPRPPRDKGRAARVAADLRLLNEEQLVNLAQPLVGQVIEHRLDRRSIGALLVLLGEILQREAA
jgi:hypothetical protein